MTQRIRWIGLVVFLILCLGAGGLGAIATTPEIEGWYKTIEKPSWNPPDYIFGPVWTTLYLVMAVGAWLVWKPAGFRAAVLPLGLFALQLVLNVAWSWVFFGLHQPGWAFAEILMLWLAIVAAMLVFFRESKLAGWLLAPYLVWVSFAGVLNFTIWRMNASMTQNSAAVTWELLTAVLQSANMKSLLDYRALSLMLLSLQALVPPARGADLVLVKDGTSQAPIVVFKDAPPYTRQAAEELATYIEKISGAKPKVIEGEPDPVPQHAIWVGFQPRVAKLFSDVDFDFRHPEEIVIAASDNHLVIAGRDNWDPDHLVVEGIDEQIVGKQMEYGTVNAVYTFLQDQLGVRWLWPGKLGEDVPRQAKISIAPMVYRYHPQIRARGGLFNFSALSNRGYGRAHDWTRRQRLQLGSLELNGGHAFTDWWERFHKTHPEYFALQPDGKRSGFPNPRTVKLCQSNPAVWKQWLADVEKKLEKNRTRQVFSGSPNDGWASGHCTCQSCRAWDHPDGEPRQFHWKSGNEIRNRSRGGVVFLGNGGGQVHVFGHRVFVQSRLIAEKCTRPRPVNGY